MFFCDGVNNEFQVKIKFLFFDKLRIWVQVQDRDGQFFGSG